MPTELPMSFDAQAAQERWLAHWEARGYFTADPAKPGEPYTIVIPPPNVTGALHMGHALNNTLQDVLIRRKRMQGFNTLWVPGTDHAGIATQAVVEKLIFAQEKKTRYDLGREALVAKIWEWKAKYETRILGQLRVLGASLDWSRTRFTLDELCTKAVRETFFKMFRDGYIYRGKRLVNWDTQLQTSVADDETYTETVKGGFWTFKYPVVGMPDTFISFSTTRPETMLGDTALCVHPDDARYTALHGQKALQPLTGREIPIITDALLADPTLGTGCVKVTPAHDPNDYACWQRHPEIGILNILNPDGTINAVGGDKYAGLDRYKVRELVVADMEALGYFLDKQDRDIPLPYSDRSKTPIEPYLSDQWFVAMGDRPEKPGLAQTAMDAVTDGRVRFFPERYAKTYLDWLGEKRDWCISRQLWWGHRIPVWTKKFASATEVTAYELVHGKRLGFCEPGRAVQTDLVGNVLHVCLEQDGDATNLEAEGFVQSDDVLDTWFSSALWPHSTLGWPEQTADLAKYYPTSTLVTSRDIITLWVARMVIMGLYNLGEVPFRDVVITPTILDGLGERMSKSKGNGVEPLDIIAMYGTDALRYYVTSIAGETQDSRLPVSNVCPHCGNLVPVKAEHMNLRTKKLVCTACKKAFRPGGPWPADDPELPTAKQASDRFEVGRNFANKLWNATRFILMNLDGYTPAPIDPATLAVEDRWIVSRLATTTVAVSAALDGYRFAEATRLIYEFTWSEFCDWYLEMAKSRRSDPVGQRVLVGVLDGILRLAHPIMPFVTESLWTALNEVAPIRGLAAPMPQLENVCMVEWPSYPEAFTAPETEAEIGRMQELIRSIREVRNRYQLDDKTKVELVMTAAHAKPFEKLVPFIVGMADLSGITLTESPTKPKQSASIVHADFEARVLLQGLIDPATESKRLDKQIAEARKQAAALQAKLANASYVKNAPAEVVQESREKVAELTRQAETLEENLRELREG